MADAPTPTRNPARTSVPESPPPAAPHSRLRRLYERFVRWGQLPVARSPEEALRHAAMSISADVPPSI